MMKKIFLALLIFISAAETVVACDICGCGVGNSYIGILPEFRKKIFGIRYRYNILRTHIGAGGVATYLTTKEFYRTAELWSGWNIGSKFRVMASHPYNIDEKKTASSSQSKSGIGDISLSGFYELINKRNTIAPGKLLVQSLWIGGGIKLPTGKYSSADKSGSSAANLFQLGTGSTDFSFNAMYDIRLNDAGLNTAAAYKINTVNKDRYEYGNKFSLSTQAYYKFRIRNKFMIAPDAGVLYENGAKDLDKGFTTDLSGGRILMGTAGVELSFKKISAGVNFQTPFSQDLAAGFVKAGGRGMVHVAVAL